MEDNNNEKKELKSSGRRFSTKVDYPKIKQRFKLTNKHQIFQVGNKSEEEKEKDQIIINKLFRYSNATEICIKALKKNPAERSEEEINVISYYLQILKNFMNIFKGQIENEELKELLNNMSSRLKYEHINKSKFIFKYGDKANKFYIIIRGKVTFCVPKKNKYYLNEQDYILYLIKLRMCKENDLIKKNLETNKFIFDLGDNFDNFVLKSLTKHEKEEEKIYSDEIYSYFKLIKELIEKEKKNRRKDKEKEREKEEKQIYEDVILANYLERTIVNVSKDTEESKTNKRKMMEIYSYERTNTFEDGDCFGLVGSNNKTNKRSATAISIADCELAVLSRDEYKQILDKITKKARERLFAIVMSYKLFSQITKYTFSNKYSHMFRFSRFYLNNEIMDDTKQFNQVIMFNSGEFILYVNKNIIELNELIVKMKKIRGIMNNIPEEVVKKNLQELVDNEAFKLNKQYTSRIVDEYINKRQNLIISTVNDKMMLGYPDTVESGTFMPLFNCKCISNTATGYTVEREMIKLFEKDHYLRTTPTKVLLLKIDFYLKRLLQHKKNIMKRIELLQVTNKKVINFGGSDKNSNENINDEQKDNNNNNDNIDININSDDNINDISKEGNREDSISDNEDNENINNLNISRNNINSISLKNNNVFEFHTNIRSPQLERTLIQLQEKNNNKTLNNNRNMYLSLDNTIYQNISTHNQSKEKDRDNFLVTISKLRQKINKKRYLLKTIQKKSNRYTMNEIIEKKKIQIKLNQLNYKEIYNDLTQIFSKDPDKKTSILDKYMKKKEDNVLDPAINDINRQINKQKRLYSFLPNAHKIINNTDINLQTNFESNNTPRNVSNYNCRNGNNLYLKKKNLLFLEDSDNDDNDSSSKNLNNINKAPIYNFKQLLLNGPNDSKLKYVKVNHSNISLDKDNIRNNNIKINNNYSLNINHFNKFYNDLYNQYVIDNYNKKYMKKSLDIKNIETKKSLLYELKDENEKRFNSLSNYHKLDNYKINKLQLINIKKARDVKTNSEYSPKNIYYSQNLEKKGISLVDPLALDKFNEIYRKERFNGNKIY